MTISIFTQKLLCIYEAIHFDFSGDLAMNVTGLCAKIASRLFVLATFGTVYTTPLSLSEEIIRISPLASGTLMPTCPRTVAPNSSAKTHYRVTVVI